MKQRNHLPRYGVGPIYVIIISLLTVLGVILARMPLLKSGDISAFRMPMVIAGCILIIYGTVIWFAAIFLNKIGDDIRSNKLATTGIYAYVRNPIYSGIAICLTGILMLPHNLWLLMLPPVFWGFMTILMMQTEEKWLTNLYGADYTAYCKKVNRCIPWFSR